MRKDAALSAAALPATEQEEKNSEESTLPPLSNEWEANQPAIIVGKREFQLSIWKKFYE